MTADPPSPPAPKRNRFLAHWTIFVPAITIALLYGGLWAVLAALGRGDMALARLLLLVALLVVPLLFVHAYLRYASFGLVVGERRISYRRGWLRPSWHRVRLDDTVGVRAVHGVLSRLLGGGALVLRLRDGRDLRLDDMSTPSDAADLIARHQRVLRARTAPI